MTVEGRVPVSPLGEATGERSMRARTLALLFACGATIVCITLLLPHAGNTNEALLAGAAAVAYAVTALLLRFDARVDAVALHVTLALGSALIAVCVIFGGDGASAYPVMYVMVAIFAAWFLSSRAAVGHIALALALYGAVFLASGDTPVPQTHWVMGVGTVAVVAFLTARQVSRQRGHREDLLAVAGMAGGLTDPERFAELACEGLRTAAHADVTVLLEPLADAEGLRVSALSGSREAADALTTPRARAALQHCFQHGERVLLPAAHAPDAGAPIARAHVAGLAEPVVRDGRVAGVLALAWARPVRSVSMRATAAALLFAAQAAVGFERLERLNRDRERRALEINDTIVQGLAVAKYAVAQGWTEEGLRAIDDTLVKARKLITDQLDDVARDGRGIRPGDLVREQAPTVPVLDEDVL